MLGRSRNKVEVCSPLVTSFAAESDNVQNNASSTLYLQTRSTLRLAPELNPDGLYFGDSIARFWDTTLDSHKSAIASDHRLNIQVVLWGSAKNYLGGLLIVQLKQDLVKTVMDDYGVYLEPNSDFHTLLDSTIRVPL